jgi:D-sedoheptulose 7-phosphate isomerase
MTMSEAAESALRSAERLEISGYLDQSIAVLKKTNSEILLEELVRIADLLTSTLRNGGKVLLAGNGGSAGDAQHIAGEFLSRLNFDRAPLAAIALTVDTSVLTAVANDYGYEQVFERQVRGLGRPGDVFVGISTSGRSPNVVRALAAARECGLKTIGFTGESGGPMTEHCDLVFHAPSTSTPLIQQVHLTAAHVVCGMVEARIYGRGG